MVRSLGISKKWQILIGLVPIILGIIVLKVIFHTLDWEVISLNALFTSIVAATIFLLGFLIAGVISDYKESERLPGDLASSLEAIYDEALILNKFKHTPVTDEFMLYYQDLLTSIHGWFHREERTRNLMDKLTRMNDFFFHFEALTQANFITRMKQEQSNVRKIITRIHTIRETSFVQSGYAIVEVLAVLLIGGLLLLDMEPLYESIFIVCVVSFIILYMLFLIKDLDNPFDYSEHGDKGNEISLKPLQDLIERVAKKG
jgi:hypothetical protein